MNTATLAVVVAVIVVIAIAVALFFWWERRRTGKLRQRFGAEYERTVQAAGDRKRAEKELESRQKRVEALDIRRLSPEDRRRFSDEWRATQARFVDEPSKAVDQADGLVNRVMQARGYPVGDFEQRAADISVYHPALVKNYRAARDIANSNRRGEANTEELRRAMVYYRDLFEDLLRAEEPAAAESRTTRSEEEAPRR